MLIFLLTGCNTFLASYKFKCNQCDESFQFKDILTRHCLIHKEKTFQCNVCNIKFRSMDQLNGHIGRMHPV